MTLESASRRSFLAAAAQLLISLKVTALPGADAQIDEGVRAGVRDQLLQMVNGDREEAGLSRLALEPLACKVADSHALDMAAGNFLSHWGRDGLKPYQRYSFAGGCDAVAENNSAAHDLESTGIKYAQLTLAQMHRTMHDEVAPNDGHRRTMLGLHHTHAGFGMAMVERELRLVELYVARYLSIAPYPLETRRKSTVRLEGRILDRKYGIHYAEVFYEPPPRAPDIAWLRQPRSYGLPAESVLVTPKLSGGVLYADGSTGELEVRADGGFRIPVRLPKNDAGIYNVVVWVAGGGSKEPFQGASASIRAE